MGVRRPFTTFKGDFSPYAATKVAGEYLPERCPLGHKEIGV
jgi:hypothetical protein